MARILVVRDDVLSRHLVRDLLERDARHEVIEAWDAASARAGMAEQPDLVLLDIQFPGGNGVELLRALRASGERGAALPVIALTASAMSGDRERFLEQGFTGYLSKPLDVRSFLTTIEGYLR